MADELKLKIVLDSGEVKEGFLNLEKQGEKTADVLTSKFLKLGSVLAAAFASAKLVNYLEDSAKAAIEAERATNALAVSLAQIGKFSTEAVSSFSEYAAKLQETTGYSDDLIKQNAALLVSIGNLSGQGLERGTKAALDLAQALQIDVGSAFDLVAKAASGSTGALGRYGIKIDENIPKGEKWAQTLKLIETRFGGLAETRLNTFEGSLIKLNVAFDELKESIGNIFVNSPALRTAINFIADAFLSLSKSITKITEGKDLFKDLLLVMIQIAGVINNFLIPPAELFVRGFVYGLGTIKLAFDTLVVILVGFAKLIVDSLVNPIADLVSGLGSLVSIINNDLGNSLKNGASSFKSFFTDPLAKEFENVKAIQESTFNTLAANADDVFANKMVGSINEFLLGLNDAVSQSQTATESIKNALVSVQVPMSGVFDLFKEAVTGFKTAALEFSKSARENFQAVGKTAFQTLGNGIGQAFAKFGQALANGEDAGKAFLDSMLGLFADIAIQLGTSFILQGIAHSLNPLTPGLGAPLIGAGAALATFGGILKALSGGKSKTSEQGVSGGGIATSPSDSTALTPSESLVRQAPSTAVSVVIQGDVLDSDASGSRIVQLINDAFDKKGVVITQGAFA